MELARVGAKEPLSSRPYPGPPETVRVLVWIWELESPKRRAASPPLSARMRSLVREMPETGQELEVVRPEAPPAASRVEEETLSSLAELRIWKAPARPAPGPPPGRPALKK